MLNCSVVISFLSYAWQGYTSPPLELRSNKSKIIFEPSVLSPIPETPSATLVTTLPPPSVSTTPPIPQQTKTPIHTPPITADATTITIIVLKSDALFAIQLRVAKLEKDMSELKKVDHSAEALATLKSQVPTTIDSYLGSKFRDVLQKELQKPLQI
ncbi:hypothetical protein Tco_0456066 [Tanacetum coccineum]